MLSNDNGESIDIAIMDVTEEVTMTPTTYLAVTPAASLKPPAQSTSDEPASYDTNTSLISQMVRKCETQKNAEVLEESK